MIEEITLDYFAGVILVLTQKILEFPNGF